MRFEVNIPDQYINSSGREVISTMHNELSGPIGESTASGKCKVPQPVDGAAGRQFKKVTRNMLEVLKISCLLMVFATVPDDYPGAGELRILSLSLETIPADSALPVQSSGNSSTSRCR